HRPVLAGPGLPVLEDDHAPDRLAALEVADVVALDPERWPGEPERLGQLLEGREGLALVRQPARLLPRQCLGRVAGREREELAFLPALRDAEVDRAAASLREERLEPGGLPDDARPGERRA